MQIELTNKEFRMLLDMVYIGNWVLNSTRGDDRFQDYDNIESKLFALCHDTGLKALAQRQDGTTFPSLAYTQGGIHEAIAFYEDNIFYEMTDQVKEWVSNVRLTAAGLSFSLSENTTGKMRVGKISIQYVADSGETAKATFMITQK